MKLTSILVLAMATGTALGQNPDIIQNTQNTMNAVQQKKTIDSNAALAASPGQPAPQASAAKPAPAVKPAATPASKSGTATAATTTATKPVTAAGKTTPVAIAKPVTSSTKPATATIKPVAATSAQSAVKPVSASAPVRIVPSSTTSTSTTKKTSPAKTPQVIAAPKVTSKKATSKAKPATAKKQAAPAQKVEVEAQANPDGNKETSKPINLTGRRDPFLSPVVNRSMVGSGCSTGKKCLAIDQINLKGVVRADNGMIAVVVNAMNKAYFLRENDPVFNGYVVKITGDSIVFKETIQDKLGKPFTREVTKKITTSAV